MLDEVLFARAEIFGYTHEAGAGNTHEKSIKQLHLSRFICSRIEACRKFFIPLKKSLQIARILQRCLPTMLAENYKEDFADFAIAAETRKDNSDT